MIVSVCKISELTMKPPIFKILSKSYWTVVIGTILVSVGILLTFLRSWLLLRILPSFVIRPNTEIGEFWRKPPMDIPTNVYMFNWTNSEDIYNDSIKPRFEERGPYRFMQTTEKVNVTWNDNDTISYRQIRVFRYDERQPNGNLSDKITTANLFSWFVAHGLQDWNYFVASTASGVIATLYPTVHVIKTVGEILYQGYDHLGSELLKYLSFLSDTRFESFGLLGYRNGSEEFEGVININNGIDGNYDIKQWNYLNETPHFEKTCARLAGSVGELHSPRHSKEDLDIFLVDVCRTVPLEYTEDVIIDGILGYKYTVGKKALDNGVLLPENKCFCKGECFPVGILDLSSCKFGLPLYASLPHFYGADPTYLDSVEGLQPDKSKHETYVIVEPNTGIPLKAVLRIQINSLMFPSKHIEVFKHIPRMFYPVLWIQMDVTLPEQFRSNVKILLSVPFLYNIMSNVIIVMGMLFLLIWVGSSPRFMLLYKSICGKPQTVVLRPEEMHLNGGQDVHIVNDNKDYT